MARAHFVKKAAKDNPVAKKGESYWWWKPMVGGRGGAKRFSKERPTRSQLTQSEYFGTAFDLADSAWPAVSDEASLDEFKSQVEELRDNEQGKLDNLPDGLRDGDTGQLIQERIDECESVISEIDSLDLPDEPEDYEEEYDGDDDNFGGTWGDWYRAKFEEAKEGVNIPW